MLSDDSIQSGSMPGKIVVDVAVVADVDVIIDVPLDVVGFAWVTGIGERVYF